MRSLLIASIAATLAAQFAPPPAYQPSEAEKQQIRDRMAVLAPLLKSADPVLLPDIEIYYKAADWILRYGEFYNQSYVANTLAALDRGIERTRRLQRGEPLWVEQKGRLVRAYRSRVDASVQPYGLAIPESYDGTKPVRLDVVLHGRGATLNEVSFIAAHDAGNPIPAEQDFIQLDVFGRTNNAYRWAGETDVFEALDAVRQRYKIDPDRIVLRGFSMGGAGAWHIGLHYPDQWAAIEAGAGFVETKIYARLAELPGHQESALHIYDAADYALNLFDVPSVGYGGEEDPQLKASETMQERAALEGLKDLRTLFLVGPKTGHRFHPESKKQSDQFITQAVAPGRREPDHLRFVTWTEKYNRCFWTTIEALERQYQRTEVDARRSAEGAVVRTVNVARLRLARSMPVEIDGQRVDAGASFEKKNGKWIPAGRIGFRKVHGLQGPIDDAFMEPFLCVRPTGKPDHPAVNTYAQEALERFRGEFAKWMRGDLRIKNDREVTQEDIGNFNLILFGDPGSNSWIRKVITGLPLLWTAEKIELNGMKFPAAEHLPVLIYPNPLNPKRYVVINSGHTFHEPEFRGTNALLFPRLGDYAVIRLAGGAVALAGLFNEMWRP